MRQNPFPASVHPASMENPHKLALERATRLRCRSLLSALSTVKASAPAIGQQHSPRSPSWPVSCEVALVSSLLAEGSLNPGSLATLDPLPLSLPRRQPDVSIMPSNASNLSESYVYGASQAPSMDIHEPHSGSRAIWMYSRNSCTRITMPSMHYWLLSFTDMDATVATQ